MKVFVVLTVIVVTCLVNAEVITWQGQSADFTDTGNWLGANPVTNSPPPSRTVFQPSNSKYIISHIKGADEGRQEVNVGKSLSPPSRLVLTKNVRISFNQPKPEDNAKPATFIGATDNEATDLACHKNYQQGKAPSPDDVIAFDDKSYRLWNSRDIDIERFSVQTFPVTSCNMLDTRQFSLDCINIDTEYDMGALHCSTASDFELALMSPAICLGHSSCPTPEMAVTQDNEARAFIKDVTQRINEQLAKEVTKSFQGTFTPGVLGLTAERLQKLLEDEEATATLIDSLESVLASRWSVGDDNVEVTSLEMTEDGLKLSIEGTVTIDVEKLLQPGQNAEDIINSESLLLFGDVDENSQIDELVRLLQESIQTIISEELENSALNDIADAKVNCGDACKDYHPLGDRMVSYFKDPEDFMELVSNCPQPATVGCVQAAFENQELTKTGLAASLADINSFIDEFSQLDLTDETIESFFEDLAQAGGDINNANDIEESISQLGLFLAPAMPVGFNLPSLDLFILNGEVNQPLLQETILSSVPGSFGIVSVQDVVIDIILSNVVTPTRRRRDASGPDAEALEVSFKFEAYCQSGQDCSLVPGSSKYNAIQSKLDQIVNTFEIERPVPCYELNSASFNSDCLDELAEEIFNDGIENGLTPEEAQQLVADELLPIIECGAKGINPDTGECYETDPEASEEAGSLALGAQASFMASSTTTTQAPSPGDSAGSGNIPIIAGAAAGGLLILIILAVVIVVFVGKSGSGAGGDEKGTSIDRTVVAFENPMYDDATETLDTAAYDNAAEGEGLYDEPVMNSDKANPLYASGEALDTLGDDAMYNDTDEFADESGCMFEIIQFELTFQLDLDVGEEAEND